MHFLSRNMQRLDWCQSLTKPGVIRSALSVSDFLDVFVRVCRALLCGLFCLLFLNQNTYFGN